MEQTEFWAIGLAFFCAFLAALGQFLFKLGSENIGINILYLVNLIQKQIKNSLD